MNYFKMSIYLRLAKNLLYTRPRISQISNFFKYVYASRFKPYDTQIHSYTPITTIIYINKKCNLSCDFCYILDDLNLKTAKEYDLTVEGLKEILHHPLVRNSLRIGFTGGEPFLNKNIFDLIQVVKASGYLLSIVTNATRIGPLASDIIRSRLDILSVSVYPENLEKIYENIPPLAGKLWIKFHKTISSDTLEEIYNTVQLALELKVNGILFLNYYPTNREFWKCVMDDHKEYLEIQKEVNQKYGKKVAIEWFEPLSKNRSIRKCRMLSQQIGVDARGQISPCCFAVPDEKEFGNLLTYQDPWNSDFYIGMREMMINPELPVAPLCEHCYLLPYNFYGI